MKRVKVGLVGVGDISHTYLKVIPEKFPQIDLVSICDLIPERALAVQKEYPNLKVVNTMWDIFNDPEIEIVLNLTRPYQHFDVSYNALKAGKHVYSEKPLAATFEEGKQLVALAKEKQLWLGGAPDTFLGAGIQTCRYLIDHGMIGDPIGAAAFMIGHGPESWHPDPEFFYKHGGGPMMDMGPYYVTALVNLLGGVKKLTGVTKASFDTRIAGCKQHFGEEIKVEIPTYVTGTMEFDSGAIGTIFTTFDVYYPRGGTCIEVYGTQGTLFVPDPNTFGGPVKLYRPEDGELKEVPLMFPYHDQSRALGLADLCNAILEKRDMRASWEQTLHVLEILTGFEKSSNLGKTIELETKFQRKPPMRSDMMPGIVTL